MGVKPFKSVTEVEAITYLKTHNVFDTVILQANARKYIKLINDKKNDTIIYKNPNWWIQNHIQPIQTICFDNRKNKCLFSYFNCIAETRNLTQFTWNKFNELETFPPREYTSTKWTDSLFTFDDITNTIHHFGTEHAANINTKNYDYTVFIFYSLSVRKQADNLIRETNIYLNKFVPNRYILYYINFDEVLYQMSKVNN